MKFQDEIIFIQEGIINELPGNYAKPTLFVTCFHFKGRFKDNHFVFKQESIANRFVIVTFLEVLT